MHTVYELWIQPVAGSVWRRHGEDYPTQEAAFVAAGLPSGFDWVLSDGPDSRLYPAVDARPSGGSGWFIDAARRPDTPEDRIELAIEEIVDNAGYDGAHHKMKCFDRVLRLLAGDRYEEVIPEDWDEILND